MGIGNHLDTWDGWQAAVHALAWQADLGVTDPIGDSPLDRYELPPEPVRTVAATPQVAQTTTAPPAAPLADPVKVAQSMADAAGTLDDLRAALAAFDHCDLKRGARNLVFADGNPAARVLILTDPPGRDEDRDGRPCVGGAGHMLDAMFAAIGLSRGSDDPATALYITPVLSWRPPENRDPTAAEIDMMRPFVERHIALVNPGLIVAMGNAPLRCLFNERGIARARGQWRSTLGRPVLPMTPASYLLLHPEAKRDAWADLLNLRTRLGKAAP